MSCRHENFTVHEGAVVCVQCGKLKSEISKRRARMNAKEFFKSKAVWAGIIAIVGGIGTIVQGEQQEGMRLIMEGLMTIFLRQGIAKVGK